MSAYKGLLFIGDPHLASRNPGARKDDYPAAVLKKVEWCLNYARAEALLPCFLGDIFHRKWERQLKLIGDLCGLLAGREVVTIFGNHDVTENALTETQALDLVVRAGLLRLVSERSYWSGTMNGQKVIVGGTSFGSIFPVGFPPGYAKDQFVFWMAHTDLAIGNVQRPHDAFEIAGIDAVVNGHIHARQPDVARGKTIWITPGNIARDSRAPREAPAVLRVDVEPGAWRQSYVEVPHAPDEEVFFARSAKSLESEEFAEIQFVGALKNLREITRRGGAQGEGLKSFLESNREAIEPDVYAIIQSLAEEVLSHAGEPTTS